MTSRKTTIDYGTMKISTLFRLLFFPTLLGFVFNSLLNLADGIFVGKGVGSDALAAINIVAPLFLVSTGIGLMFGIGASVKGGIYLARRSFREANLNMTRAFVAAAVIMSVIVGACYLFPDSLLNLLGCSDRLYAYASTYLKWLMPGCLMLMIQMVGMMLIRLDGSPKYAMLCNVIPATCNIVLDYVMVFPLDMGIAGASIATSVCCMLGGSMVLLYFLKFSTTLKFCRQRLDRMSLVEAARENLSQMWLGISAFLGEISIAVTMLTGNYVFMRYLGEDGVAAFSVCCYLFPLMFMINNAVAQSAQPIMSYNYGASRPDRVGRALTVSVVCGEIGGLLASGLLWLAGRQIVGLFLDQGTAAYEIASSGVGLFGCSAVFFAANIAFIGFFQSVEKAVRATVYTLFRGIVFLIPAFIIMPAMLGTSGLWIAIPLAEFLTLAVIVIDFSLNRANMFKAG